MAGVVMFLIWGVGKTRRRDDDDDLWWSMVMCIMEQPWVVKEMLMDYGVGDGDVWWWWWSLMMMKELMMRRKIENDEEGDEDGARGLRGKEAVEV